MKQSKLYIGLKVNMLTILGESKRDDRGHILYNCKCDCGNIKEVWDSSLHNGTMSCGCMKKKLHQQTSRNTLIKRRETASEELIGDTIGDKTIKTFKFFKDTKYAVYECHFDCECTSCGYIFVDLPYTKFKYNRIKCKCKKKP